MDRLHCSAAQRELRFWWGLQAGLFSLPDGVVIDAPPKSPEDIEIDCEQRQTTTSIM